MGADVQTAGVGRESDSGATAHDPPTASRRRQLRESDIYHTLPLPGSSALRVPLDVTTGLPGRHQATNAIVALTMLDAIQGPLRVSPEQAIPALARVQLPGRFSRHGDWIFDVAHNPDGAAVSAEALRAIRPSAPVVALVSVLGDKDWRGMLRALSGAVDRFILTNAPTAPASRAWVASEALSYAISEGWKAELVPDFDEALRLAPSRGATVLVTGSFHTVGDAMSRLQVSPTDG